MSGTPRVSRGSHLPLYHQIELDMRQRLHRGEWRSGQRIPTERELEAMYSASRITIRQAVSNLVAEGLVVREPGRGTFVRDATFTAAPRGVTSFTDEMLGLGLQAGARLLAIRLEAASAEVAQRLHIAPGSPVVMIKRLRLGDDKPMGLQTARLPAIRVPGLERASLADHSLYAYLEQHHGIIPAEAEETFRVGAARGEAAELLKVPEGTCSFLVERLTSDHLGPFEFVTSVFRGDRYRIRLMLRSPR